MIEPGTVVRSPRGTVVEVLESSPERLRIRRALPPATGRTPLHYHLNGIETFTVLDGEVSGRSGAGMRLLRAGDVLEVPVNTPHVHPHTAADATAVIEHTIEPQPQFVQVYFPSWMGWLADGRVNGQDEPTFLSVMSVIGAGGGGTWIKGPPVPAQKALARVLGPVAAARGYRPVT